MDEINEQDIAFDWDSFSGVIPVFPLPEVVLFPHMLLPLHIFEPRYRQMVADALEGDRLIGMAMLQEGWEEDYHGSPPIFERLGVGRIVRSQALPDGRFNILLVGLKRAEVVEECATEPYRTARITLIEDEVATGSEEVCRVIRETLLADYHRLQSSLGSQPALDELLSLEDLPLGTMTDALAAVLKLDAGQKQCLLEEVNVLRRANQLSQWIEVLIRSTEFYDNLSNYDDGDPRLN